MFNFGSSQPCSHAFWVLTSLHLLSFLLKMFFIILVSIVFFLNDVNIFCRWQKYWCKLYIIKSYNHIFIKFCSSMKVSQSFVCINYLFILLHLQMMSILYFTYSTVCSPSVCHCVNPFSIPMLIIVYNIIIQWL